MSWGVALFLVALVAACAWGFWRFFWFARDPARVPSPQEGIVSPADGTVVYVKQAAPGEDVVVIKEGLAAKVSDIVREDVDQPKMVIGIFMSPFDVHYNRAPLDSTVEMIRSHPGHGPNLHMGPMHWRILLKRPKLYTNSAHIVQNERTVTRFLSKYRDHPFSYYVVQIGAKTVNGIDSYFKVGEKVTRGEKFGMIRVGSQVDLIVPMLPGLEATVKPGMRVRAGETVVAR